MNLRQAKDRIRQLELEVEKLKTELYLRTNMLRIVHELSHVGAAGDKTPACPCIHNEMKEAIHEASVSGTNQG